MTTYSEIIDLLKEEEVVNEFYWFQGANSFEYYNIKSNHYVYFSRTKNHHYYFSVRRIRQLINTTVLKNTPYIISNKQLKDDSIYNTVKETPNLIERVDRKIYGGGYGVSNVWLNLLDDLTLFSTYTRITNKDVLDIVKNMRNDRKITTPYLISSILESKKKTYKISDNLYNAFHKYTIMNDLEEIYEQKLYLENSAFSSSSTETINRVLTSYQKNRDKILLKLDKNYRKYY